MPDPIAAKAPDAALPSAYRRIRTFLAWVLNLFFRELQVVGLENVPKDRGGILVAWHPNGVVDGLLIIGTFPGHVVLGARHGLFKWPLLGRLLKAMKVTPIYRRIDLKGLSVEEQRAKNAEALSALAAQTSGGSFSMLFPEGDSHDASFIQGLKSGVARMYYQARGAMPDGAPPPVIIPVGLHYDEKKLFRSRVLVEFMPVLELPVELDVTPPADEDSEQSRERARQLMEVIRGALRQAVLETEDWEVHELFHRARKLIRAERAHRAGADPGRADMEEKVMGLARIWTAYQNLMATSPKTAEDTIERLRTYDAELKALGVEDHELERPPRLLTFWRATLLFLQLLSALLLVPPLLTVGYIVNLPPAYLLNVIAKKAAKKHKDVASMKLLGGVVLFPLVWAIWGGLAAWGFVEARMVYPGMPDHAVLVGLITVLICFIGGLLTISQMTAVRATIQSLRVRLIRTLRPSALWTLRAQRAELCDHMLALADGMTLPGAVEADGSISRG